MKIRGKIHKETHSSPTHVGRVYKIMIKLIIMIKFILNGLLFNRWIHAGIYIIFFLFFGQALFLSAHLDESSHSHSNTVVITPATGKQKKITFDHLSIADGLSQSSVTCIIQDHKGFMWLGTEYGLNKYDGNQFTHYFPIPGNDRSLSHNVVRSILEDEKGWLWIGTRRGLARFNRETETFTRIYITGTDPKSFEENNIFCMAMDAQGTLWLGTHYGLGALDPEIGKTRLYRHDPQNENSLSDNTVNCMCTDTSGSLWIGTSDGLNYYNPRTHVFTTIRHNPQNPNTPNGNDISSIYCDRSGNLWIGIAGVGFDMYNPHTGEFSHYCLAHHSLRAERVNLVNNFIEDGNGTIYLGTLEGLLAFDRKNKCFACWTPQEEIPASLSDAHVRTLYEDRSGLLWIGTRGGGINIHDPKKEKFTFYKHTPGTPNSLSYNFIHAIFEDKKGTLWVGYLDNGLDRLDREKGTVTHYLHDPADSGSISGNTVRAVFEDKAGSLWVGTRNGLNKFNRTTKRFTHYIIGNGPDDVPGNAIEEIVENPPGTLWLGTERGINKLDIKSGNHSTYYPYPNTAEDLKKNHIYTLVFDRTGNLWAGTYSGGLEKFNRADGSFIHYPLPSTTPGTYGNLILHFIHEDRSNIFWLGTIGGGLGEFDPKTGDVTYYNTSHGLANNHIYGILEDEKGNLWLSSDKGISRFNPITHTFKNYTPRDGLQGYEFNAKAFFKSSRSGEMFFGGVNGLNSFFPANIKKSNLPPPIEITGFKLFNQSISIGGDSPLQKHISETSQITLSHRQNFFSFNVAALDYTAPGQNRYKYKMAGFLDKWIDLGTRHSITFTGLEPGIYTLEVNGANSDGVWNKTGKSLKIVINPPYWQTWWFRSLLLIICLLLVIWLHRSRTGGIRQKMEKEKLEDELKLKADFTAMLVHDLRNPLTAVIGYAEMMSTMPEKMNMERTGKIISRSASGMMLLINDMLDFSKFEAGKMTLCLHNYRLVTVLEETADFMSPLMMRKGLVLVKDFAPGMETETLDIDEAKIGQVVSNLISNAVKFSPTGGTLTLQLIPVITDDGQSFLECSLTDEGPGIPETRRIYLFEKYARMSNDDTIKGTGLGLAVSRMIIEAHRGTIGYRLGPNGKGSIFYFRLPRKNSEQKTSNTIST